MSGPSSYCSYIFFNPLVIVRPYGTGCVLVGSSTDSSSLRDDCSLVVILPIDRSSFMMIVS